MRKTKTIFALSLIVTLLFSSMTVYAASPAESAKRNADYMMSLNENGVPNWFDGAYYSNSYADLEAAFGTDEKALYHHSLQYGFNEGRLVTPVLDVAKYRANNPDLQDAFGDDWNLYIRHYFEYGIAEGRDNYTDFDAETYLSMHEDLQVVLGTDYVSATRHYIEYGMAEGREYNRPKPVYKASDEDANDIITETFEDGSYIKTEYADGKIISLSFYSSENVLTNHEIYNEQGYLYLDLFYDEITGNLTHTYTYTYDADGNRIQSVIYDAATNETITFVCKFDSNGNEIEVTQYNENELTYITKYEYNDARQPVRQVEINNLGEIARIRVYTYNSDGILQSIISYYGDTTNIECEMQYYESGAIKSQLVYDAEGNLIAFYEYDEDGNLL